MIKIFEQLGYSEREANVYLACLSNDYCTINDIKNTTKLSRSTIYYILDELMNLGIISQVLKNKKKCYIAEDPGVIKNILQNRFATLNNSIEQFDTLLPSIESKRNKNKKDSKIKYFVGAKPVKNLQTTLYKRFAKSTCYAISSNQNTNNSEIRKVFNNSINERKKNEIFFKGISPYTEEKFQLRAKDGEQMRESRFLPVERFSFRTDVIIFDNVVALYSFENNEPSAVVIEDQNMVDTMKMIFDLAWEAAEKYDKEVVAEYEKANFKSQISNSKQK